MTDKHEQTGYIAPKPIKKGFLSVGRKQAESAVMKSADGTRYMFIITSNSYQDREGEFITTKALEQYVAESWPADDRCITNNKHLYWHDDNIHMGDIVWCDMQGPFLIELSKERTGSFTHKGVEYPVSTLWDYFEQHPEDKQGASHRFKYFDADRADGTYEWIKKDETTTLPLSNAANGITFSGVIDMTTKDNVLDKIVGIAGFGTNVRKGPDQIKAALDELGIQHKAAAMPPPAAAPAVAPAETAAEPAPEAGDEATALANAVWAVIEANNGKEGVTTDQVRQQILTTVQQQLAATAKPEAETETPPPPAAKALATDDLGRLENPMEVVKVLTKQNSELGDTQAQLVVDQGEIVKAFQAIVPAINALSGIPTQMKSITDRLADVEKQLSGRPRVASQDVVTKIDSSKLPADMQKAQEEYQSFFGVPVKNIPK